MEASVKLALLLLTILSLPQVNAGNLLWVDSSMVSSYEHTFGNCDRFTLGIGENKYWFDACGGQLVVKSYMESILTSPATRECVKTEDCRGNRCYREFGTRPETFKLLLVIGKKDQIDSFKIKLDVGSCR